MKSCAAVVGIGILLLGFACSKKSTEPEQKPTEDYSLVATQTIGSRGGSIQTDDFLLEVPDGAFSSNFELKLYASSEDKPFGDNCASRTFRLEGLPDEYSQPLNLCVKYEGTMSGETYIGFGQYVSFGEPDTMELFYSFLSATDSSGYLVCELPATIEAAGSPKKGHGYGVTAGDPFLDNFIVAITNYTGYLSSGGHFYIYYPASVAGTVDELAEYLEEAYDTFEQMGFSYYGPDYDHPKVDSIHVVVRDLGQERSSGSYHRFNIGGKLGPPHGKMRVNKNHVSSTNLSQLRIDAGRAFFGVVLGIYSPTVLINDYNWLHPASAIWTEEKFTEEANYVPSDFKGYEMDPFIGIGKLYGIRNGASAVIKYIADHYGDSTVVKILDAWSYVGTHSITALLSSVPDPEYEWWPDFFKEYISGEVYGVKSDVFLKNTSGLFDIKSSSDTDTTFTGRYFDLSAKLYRINLDYAHIDTNAQIELNLAATDANLDYVTIMVFSLKDGSLQYLTWSTPELTIKNIKALTQDGNDLLIAVINSLAEEGHFGERDIDLEVSVISQPELPYNWCRISLGYIDMNFNVGDTADYWDQRYIDWEGEGGFSGRKFTATWHDIEVSPGMFSSGDMTVEVDRQMPDSLNVVSFSATKTDSVPGWQDTTMTSVSGSNIPFAEFDDFYNLFLSCKSVGEEACTHIGNFDYERRFNRTWERIIGYKCKTESEIRIEFWEWHGE